MYMCMYIMVYYTKEPLCIIHVHVIQSCYITLLALIISVVLLCSMGKKFEVHLTLSFMKIHKFDHDITCSLHRLFSNSNTKFHSCQIFPPPPSRFRNFVLSIFLVALRRCRRSCWNRKVYTAVFCKAINVSGRCSDDCEWRILACCTVRLLVSFLPCRIPNTEL